MLVDTHSHIFFYKEKVDDVIKECKEKGVKYIVENGLNVETNRIVLNEAKKYDIVLAALGFHPVDISKEKEDIIEKEIEFIKENKDKIVAIGEVGLDYYWVKEKDLQEKQKKYLYKFIELAEDIKKPLIVHSRNSEKDIIDILSTTKAKVILHSYMGRISYAKKAIDFGFYFSVPSVVYKRKDLHRLIEEIPLELILTETDSPFLDPVGYRNNKPWKVIYGLETITKIKKVDLEELKAIIIRNFEKVFQVKV